MNIMVKDCACPICGAPEIDPKTNKLLVRGFKAEHSGLWWSECISGRGHGTTIMVFENGTEVEVPIPDKLWFALTDDGGCAMEVQHDNKTYIVTTYFEEV